MRKKALMTAIFSLLFGFLLVASLNIGAVWADGPIYIRADGSVEGTDKIQRDGDFYTFTGNIYDRRILVERNDIVIDGTGYTLRGDSRGIVLSERNNVTVKKRITINFTLKPGTSEIRI